MWPRRSPVRGPSAQAAATPPITHGTEESSAPLTPPVSGSIPVAFVLAQHAVVIDFAGPWEVFRTLLSRAARLPSVSTPLRNRRTDHRERRNADHAQLLVRHGACAEDNRHSRAAGAHREIVEVDSQRQQEDRRHDVRMHRRGGVAATGLLAGKSATTHHTAYREMAMDHPDITVKR